MDRVSPGRSDPEFEVLLAKPYVGLLGVSGMVPEVVGVGAQGFVAEEHLLGDVLHNLWSLSWVRISPEDFGLVGDGGPCFGCFQLEVENLGGRILGSEESGDWQVSNLFLPHS